jgi:hypothetical protein
MEEKGGMGAVAGDIGDGGFVIVRLVIVRLCTEQRGFVFEFLWAFFLGGFVITSMSLEFVAVLSDGGLGSSRTRSVFFFAEGQ